LIGVYKSKSLKPVIDAGHMHFYQIIRKLGLAGVTDTNGLRQIPGYEKIMEVARERNSNRC